MSSRLFNYYKKLNSNDNAQFEDSEGETKMLEPNGIITWKLVSLNIKFIYYLYFYYILLFSNTTSIRRYY